MSKKTNKDFSELKDFLSTYSWAILLTVVVFGFLGFIGCTLFGTPMYKATTQIYVCQIGEDGLVFDDLKVASQLQWDCEAIITGRKVAEEAIKMLNLDLSADELREGLTVKAEENTRIMNLCYTDADPIRAAQIVNTVRELSIRKVRQMMDEDVIKTIYEAQVPKKASQNFINNMTAAVTGMFLGVIGSVGGLSMIFFMKKREKRKGNYLRRRKENGNTQ